MKEDGNKMKAEVVLAALNGEFIFHSRNQMENDGPQKKTVCVDLSDDLPQMSER